MLICSTCRFRQLELFFQDILGDVICINLFNHFRCECESAEECICCQAISTVIINMEDSDISCITEHDILVANCLNRHVLHMSMLEYLENLGPLDDNELQVCLEKKALYVPKRKSVIK
jgi:hypothetical protein